MSRRPVSSCKMSGAFSSDEAEEDGDEQDYETLEEYIFNTERDQDKEVRKAIRFREWQEMQLRIIKNKLGTNAVEVVARSYLMGLARLREEHHDEVDDVSEMLTDFLIVVGMDPRNDETVDHIGSKISDYSINDPEYNKSDIKEPRNYSIRESAVSEVENNYVQDAFFGPWIHRYVAALGFLDSELVTEVTENKLSSFSSAVADSMEDARDEIESMIMDYVSMSQAHWIHDGIDKNMYDMLWDVTEHMETDRKETCEQMLNRSKDLINEEDEE